eukprot:5529718-Pleurochrysis_carterae.AAC.1
MRLHHALDGHASGGGRIFGTLRDDAYEIAAAPSAQNAKLVASRSALNKIMTCYTSRDTSRYTSVPCNTRWGLVQPKHYTRVQIYMA